MAIWEQYWNEQTQMNALNGQATEAQGMLAQAANQQSAQNQQQNHYNQNHQSWWTGSIYQHYTGGGGGSGSAGGYVPQRDFNSSLEQFASKLLRDGLEITEIKVPKDTYLKILQMYPSAQGMNGIHMMTTMGRVQITLDDGHKFEPVNWDKYMEVVDTAPTFTKVAMETVE